MSLITQQAALEAYLTDEGALPSDALLGQIRSSTALSALEGLKIYHNAYRARLLTVLREDFPALHQWMGEESFEQLAMAYIAAWPPRHFSIRWLGERLPEFIGCYVAEPQLSPMRELAELEWAFTLAFDAQDAEALSLETMSSFSAEDWISLRVALTPSARWLQLQYNTLELWKAAKSGDLPPAITPLPANQDCLVWRYDLVCQYRSLEPEEASALKFFVERGSFAELCELLGATHGEQAPLQAATWLKLWVDEGLLKRKATIHE
ncbi:DNA-binding domain-containing protein [Pseudomonas sp. J452]|uniref:HvfC/BufC N-terminal domain-containing protein n=1 Tax=Pseudomonas sp. J452 TaxID=2898441 RepID=UPI0021AE163C|nr:DNA-binding domain-containing protein [Pseudomonas sp. J452]UUY07469.1 DNA-binding domain-containing protein [Pseudomonas sp. J452]